MATDGGQDRRIRRSVVEIGGWCWRHRVVSCVVSIFGDETHSAAVDALRDLCITQFAVRIRDDKRRPPAFRTIDYVLAVVVTAADGHLARICSPDEVACPLALAAVSIQTGIGG
jgi:hypothetical protein